jgi:hypothetical protein
MTRETKAGLVVSFSFLCLVGVVLYSKLNGPKLPAADAYVEGSVEAPPAPTPVEENTSSQTLPFGSDNSGSPSEKLADAGRTEVKTNGIRNNDVSAHAAKMNDGPAVPDQSVNSDIASNSASKETSSANHKNASASSNPTYAIPDPVEDEKNVSSVSSSKTADSDNKIAKTGATLDPIQDVKETKDVMSGKEEKNSQDASKASWVIPPEESPKEKKTEAAKNGLEKTEATTSVTPMTSGDAKNNSDAASTDIDKQLAEQKKLAEQDPPPIPKGLHDPFQSLPETPATAPSPAGTANRSPRDAGSRKATTNPVKAANGTQGTSGTSQGITGITASPSRGNSPSSIGTVATTTAPNLTQPNTSSPASTGDALNSSNQVATNSSQGRSLTPGVMPSPRMMALPPAGDTAPEPNVRLGPPTGGLPSNQPISEQQAATPNPATSLPPSNQVAQGPAPNISGPGGVSPYQTSGPTSGNISAPNRTPNAQVDSYDEETYLCKQGDSFAAISTKFYLNEKYAQALLLFNRNHPRATAGVRQDPPSLAAGQPVYIPPLRVLEKRYATAIPDHASADPQGTQTSANPDKGSTALPAGPKEIAGPTGGPGYSVPDTRNLPSTPTAPRMIPKPSTSPTERVYVVSKNGETFWDISRRTLSNPNRWWEISQLNKQIDPSRPVPVGTPLRMPADARIDPPNSAAADRGN